MMLSPGGSPASKENELITFIAQNYQRIRGPEHFGSFLRVRLQSHDPDILQSFCCHLIKWGIEKYHGPLLQCIQKTFFLPDVFDAHVAALDLSPSEQEKLKQLLALDPQKAEYIQKNMQPFVNGYGNIKYEDALLTLAQIKERKRGKDYPFDPILLAPGTEQDLLTVLSAMPKPITVHYVVSGNHFGTGLIKITEDNIAKVWIVDPIGVFLLTESQLQKSWKNEYPPLFQKYEIFIAQEKRQRAKTGCSVFALDDIAHMANLHLPPQYAETGIWGYLSDAAKSPTATTYNIPDPVCPGTVTVTPSPLSLLRTMQSRTVLKDMIPSRDEAEQKSAVNQKQQTAAQSIAEHFILNENEEGQNTRIDYKFAKMAESNWQFLLAHTPQEAERLKQHFTLASFQQRLGQSASASAADRLEAPPQPDLPEAAPTAHPMRRPTD